MGRPRRRAGGRPPLDLPRAGRGQRRVRAPAVGPRCGARRPGGADDVQPAGVRGGHQRHQQDRRGGRAAQPGLEGGGGAPRPGAHRLPSTPWPTGRPWTSWVVCSAPTGSPTSTQRLRSGCRRGPAGTWPNRRPPSSTRRCWSSARGRPACPRRSATPTVRWACATAHWWPPWASARTTGSRWPRRLRTSSACSTCWPRRRPAPRVRLHRRFDLDEVLRRIESERMTLEMAVAPIALAMANHPDLERYDLSSLRYIMWGATPVSEHVARVVTERTGVRWLPAYGASEVPVIACNPVDDPGRGGSTRPDSRPRAWNCGSPTSSPGRCSNRAGSARSRCRARRSWPATSPRRRRRTPSPTVGTARVTSDGWSPTVGST